MFRFTANGNYLVHEDFGVFDNQLTLDQKNQKNGWTRVNATLPEINVCLQSKYPNINKPCNWIKEQTKCTKDKYGYNTCYYVRECKPSIQPTSYCMKKGPMCNRSTMVEDVCCPHQSTVFGSIGTNKYCAWKNKLN